MRAAAPRDRSMIRTPLCGCRSVIVTVTALPVSCIVTFTRLPSGRLGWAAVMRFWSNASPLLVRRPWCRPPYQDATPVSSQAGCPAAAARAPTVGAAKASKVATTGSRRAAVAITRHLTEAWGGIHAQFGNQSKGKTSPHSGQDSLPEGICLSAAWIVDVCSNAASPGWPATIRVDCSGSLLVPSLFHCVSTVTDRILTIFNYCKVHLTPSRVMDGQPWPC